MKKVLIVEDSLPIRQQISQVLSDAGYTAIEAVDGLDGLERLRAQAAGQGETFELVLCDVNMPRMGGLDLLDEIKRTGIATPFVILTSEAVPALMRRARAAGAVAWVVKPVKPFLLISAINKIIGPPS